MSLNILSEYSQAYCQWHKVKLQVSTTWEFLILNHVYGQFHRRVHYIQTQFWNFNLAQMNVKKELFIHEHVMRTDILTGL